VKRTQLDPNRIYAISQFQGVIQLLSRAGLIRMLVDTYQFPQYAGNEDLSRADLIAKIMACEYGPVDMELYHALSSKEEL